ncbi:DUF4391 domain-containing protein [Sphingomonas sp. CFBP 13603]|uniref:DUF4391 domain-containing protein n=1 Tax=Sphingomonas sp. CFBP 13603 TaxID=2774040 RepID=UPI001866AF68|nr:DUF4391 domain-containing protein [Sphingomonas sp. CFBP 13603]MBE2993071.1 DUF4391 domain-containing protein [Sphingomonas sp. CFBP 13603]
MTITPADVRAALALPPMGTPARRLPKEVLAQHGAANTADRKLIDSTIERLDWWATLSPGTVGVAADNDGERPVPAIQLLAMTARVEPTQRLLTLVHRAIPVPIILATALPGNAGTRLSVAPLRRAERVADQMVVERLIVAPDLAAHADTATTAFLGSLALPALPQTTLAALYGGLIERVEALAVAHMTEAPFQCLTDPASVMARRNALDRYRLAEAEWLATRSAAKRENRLAEQVVLGNQARALKDRLQAIAGELADAPMLAHSVFKEMRADGVRGDKV